jgi:Rrf2 family protein
MLDLARSAGTEIPISLAAVADSERLSHGYLEQLAHSLRTAQLLRGVCGKGGGYKLAREPEDISVRDVIEAVIGPINIVECVEKPRVCPRADTCECRGVYMLINRRITEALDGFTLADLLDPERVRCLSAEAAETERPRAHDKHVGGSTKSSQRRAGRRRAGDADGCPGG